MNQQRKLKLSKKRARNRRSLIPTKQNSGLTILQNRIEERIPDKRERETFINDMIDALVITCDNCDFRLGCDHNYQDCQYNPANEEN